MSTRSVLLRRVMLRGGSCGSFARDLRASDRVAYSAEYRDSYFGFRVCRVSPIEKPSAGALVAGPPKR